MTLEQALITAIVALATVVTALAGAVVALWRIQVAANKRCEKERKECEDDRISLWESILELHKQSCSACDCGMRSVLPVPKKPKGIKN